jgi:sec-independent protein translocase protein TatA
MFGMGTQELFVILLIVIFIFGVNKIPQLGKGLGEGIKNFKSALKAGRKRAQIRRRRWRCHEAGVL